MDLLESADGGKRVSCTGVGLHSGKPATLTLAPAPADAGITFVRMDLGVEIPARNDLVVDTMLSTSVACRERARLDGGARARRARSAWGSTTAASRWTGRRSRSSTAPPRRSSASSRRRARSSSALAGASSSSTSRWRCGTATSSRASTRRTSFVVEFTADFDHPLVTNQSFRVAPLGPVLRARGRACADVLLPAGTSSGCRPPASRRAAASTTPSSSTSSRS